MTAMSLMDKDASIARITAHIAAEAEKEVFVTGRGEIPVSADYVSKQWLTEILCSDVPGAEVVSFSLGAKNLGTTARRLIDVAYNEAGVAAKLPERIFAKATPEFASRFVCGLSGALDREVHFYRHIQQHLDIPTPACYFADYDPDSFRSIFLFENEVATKGADFLDPTFRPSRTQAESMIVVLAKLHSRFWEDDALDRDFPWLVQPLAYQEHINQLIGFQERTAIGMERAAQLMPVGMADRKSELWPAFMRSCDLRSRSPRTLIHTDVHLGNWYRVGNDMGLCDWQTTMKGNWAVDFAYAVTCSLTVEERRAWERDLLKLYLDTLSPANGSPKPSFDEAWLAYRQHTLHGLYNWFFVAGIDAGETEMHSDAFWKTNLTRMIVAADELRTLDALAV